MDALKIALETIIVGVLALPWMFLIVDIFCPSKEALINGFIPKLDNQTIAAVAGLVLFALAYLVGSAVVRISEDFFNDDDLSTHITENEIRTDVYCQPSDQWLIRTGVETREGTPELLNPCPQDGSKIRSAETNNRVAQTFAVQESSIWISDADKAGLLRHLRQQIVILRGVAFDGIVVTLLCLFATCATLGIWGRRSLVVVALLVLGWAADATFDHLHDHLHRMAGDPPLMEVVLLAIAIAGFVVAWRGVSKRSYFCGLMFSAMLTGIAFFGWWYSEILYTKNIIFFFYAKDHVAAVVGR